MAVVSLKQKLTENWRNGAIGAAIAVFAGWLGLIYYPNTGYFLSHKSYDLPLRLHSGLEETNVVVISMDQDSHDNLFQQEGQEWHRALHAQLIRKLVDEKAAAVAFDILFKASWVNEPMARQYAEDPRLMNLLTNRLGLPAKHVIGRGVDDLFAEVLRTASNVVLGASCVRGTDERGNKTMSLTRPDASLGTNILWGVVEFPRDSDNAVRQHNRDPDFVGFAWKVAELTGDVPPNAREERLRRRWIKYYGLRKTVTSVSYYKVFEPEFLAPNYFSNKVVFVGKERTLTAEGTDVRDEHPTPFKEMPGVEIQATAFLNLKNRDFLTELPPLAEFLLFALLGAFLGYGLTLVRPWIAAALAIAAFVAIAGANLYLVWQKHYWFPWLTVGVAQILPALGWAFFSNTKRVYHEKEVLEETLSKVKSGVLTPPSSEGATQMAIALPGGRMVKVGPGGGGTDGATLVVTAAGPQIPDHQLVRCIGKGAYGEVWLARDIIGSYHAVKIVYRKSFSNDGPFEREFKGIQKFTPISRLHRGFVHVLHVGRNEPEGYFYYIMEVGDDEVSGQNIDPATYSAKNLAREIQNRGKLPVEECLQLSLDLTSALDFLHQQQLIHRDIKPSNIIFVNDVPKIADIGLVTSVAENGKDVTYIGTDGYIPPEGPGSPAADVYSLGKVLYETAMGRSVGSFPELPSTLFERRDHRELLQFNEIILKACEVNAAIRYKTAGQMRADLLQLQNRMSAQRKV